MDREEVGGGTGTGTGKVTTTITHYLRMRIA